MYNQNDPKSKADSLMKESEKKKVFAKFQNKAGEALVKKGLGDKDFGRTQGLFGKAGNKIPTGRERIEIARKLREEASSDSAQAVSLMKRLKSMKK